MKRERDAGREYAEIWGETVEANRKLRTLAVILGGACLALAVLLLRFATVEPPRPLVVRVDEVGRAEAVAYEAATAQADPLDPTTKYFLNRFIADFLFAAAGPRSRSTGRGASGSSRPSWRTRRSRGTAPRWPPWRPAPPTPSSRSSRSCSASTRLPEAPHGATADFDLVHLRDGQETLRERWSLTLRFTFLAIIPSELVVYNPMGILITYLQADRALVTEQPR